MTKKTEQNMRVVLAGGADAMRGRLKRMLIAKAAIDVTEIKNMDSLMEEIARVVPDAVLLTSEKETRKSIFASTKSIASCGCGTRVVIITDDVARDMVPAIKAGAAGLLSVSVDRTELLSSLLIPTSKENLEPSQ